MLVPETTRQHLLPHFISYAIGALLGAAFLALLPHALAEPGLETAHKIMLTVLLGVLMFFLLEKMVLWRHCHSYECEVHGSEEHTMGLIALWVATLPSHARGEILTPLSPRRSRPKSSRSLTTALPVGIMPAPRP